MELGGAALPRGTSDRNPKFAASVYRFNLLPHFSEIKEFGRYSTPELEIDRNQTFPHHFTARVEEVGENAPPLPPDAPVPRRLAFR